MKNIFLQKCSKKLLVVLLLTLMLCTQLLIPLKVTANTADQQAVDKLEQLYKSYITKYGAKTTKEGLMRVYDEAFEIDGESFEAEKDAGYEVELSATVLRSVNGAKDQDGEIVPKHDGSVNIYATVKKNNAAVGNIEFSQTVKAEVKNLTYTKSSESESDVWSVRVAPEATYLNKYTGTADKLVIPEGVEEINYNNRLTWCQNKENVKIIILPSTMKKVITDSFRAFPNLEAIYVPDGCQFIGYSAFRENPSLRYVRLPEDLTNIPANYFWDTPALTSLYIPRTVQNLDRAFKNTALRDVVLTNENFKANSANDYTTYFEGLIQDVNSDQIPDGKKIQNAALRAEVAEELTDDRGQIAKRNIYVLGSNATSPKVTWAKFTAVNDALAEVPVYNSKDYTQVYGLAGNALDTAATGTEQTAFAGKYTTLTAAQATTLINQYNAATAVFNDAEVVAKLENLYKAYITQYGAKTTKEGLMRVYDEAIEIDGESFEAEKDAGYEVKLSATVLRPVNGAKDQDGEIVPKHNGFVNIHAIVKKYNQQVGEIEFSQRVLAEVKTLTYTKSSESENSEEVWNRGGAYLNKYTGTADKLVIPEGVEEINYNNRTNWCENKENVKIIILPSTMELATKESFKGFPNLQAVYIPDGCVLGDWLFENCSSLRYVRLPEDDNVNKITVQSFNGTPALTSLYIPKNIKIIGRSFNNSALRDVVLTNDDIAATKTSSNNYFDGLVQQATETQIPDAALRAEVNEELTDDRGLIAKRNIYILGSNVASSTEVGNTKDWKYITGVENNGAYTHVYGLAGNALDAAATGTEQAAFEGKYTTVSAELAETLTKQYHILSLLDSDVLAYPEAEINSAIDNLTVTNKTSPAKIQEVIDAVIADSGYIFTISDWAAVNAVPGCKDQSGILFEGYKGYISAKFTFTSSLDVKQVDFEKEIEPEIYEYSFASAAFAENFEKATINSTNGYKGATDKEGEYFFLSEDGKTLISYCGNAEKIIIPEGVEYLAQDWWLECDLKAVRCIILPDSLKVLPDQFAVPFRSNIEVIIMGDNVTKAEGKHTFWKCFRLKNLRLSENLENLTEEALFQTLSLGYIRLPNNLKRIEKGALHLTAFRNIVVPESVEFISNEAFGWPLRKLEFLTPANRPQGNAVSVATAEELEPVLQANITYDNGANIPRTITILSTKAEYNPGSKNYWNTSSSWCAINVRYIENSTTADLVAGGYKQATYSILNMSKPEVSIMLKDAINRVPVSNETDKSQILKFLKSTIKTDILNDDFDISDLTIQLPNKDAEGILNGTITVTLKESSPISIAFNRTLKYKASSVLSTEGEWGSGDDIYANRFVPNITNPIITSATKPTGENQSANNTNTNTNTLENNDNSNDVISPDGTTVEAGTEEEVVVRQEVVKRYKVKKPRTETTNPIIYVLIALGSVVLFAGITVTVAIVVKKKRAKKFK